MSRAGSPVLCAVVGLAACRGAPEGRPALPVAPSAGPAPSPPPVLWERFEEAQGWPAAAEWAPSAGHGVGDWSVQVRAEPAVVALYRSLDGGTAFAPGSVLVAFHRTAGGEAGPVFAMTKDQVGSWGFMAVDASGHLDPSADLELCARCHAEAPFGGLFGVRPPPVALPGPAAASSGSVRRMTGGFSPGSAAAPVDSAAPAAFVVPLR